jgi:Cu(I)/Ag(I) efflux system protein CusF
MMMFRALVLAAALAACSQPTAGHDGHAQGANGGPVVAKGEVVVLQPEYSAVTIRHEPIPAYDMGAMTMEFTTDSADQLKGLKVGDHVTFELKGPTEIATIKAD